MKLNKNGINNLAVIVACILVIFLIGSGVKAQYIFGVLGMYAIYLGWQTIHYQEVPRKTDYSKVVNKKMFCIHTGIWMVLLGAAFICLCIGYSLGLGDIYFWGGIGLSIVLAFFYNFVVNRFLVAGVKSNLEKMIELLKPQKRK